MANNMSLKYGNHTWAYASTPRMALVKPPIDMAINYYQYAMQIVIWQPHYF